MYECLDSLWACREVSPASCGELRQPWVPLLEPHVPLLGPYVPLLGPLLGPYVPLLGPYVPLLGPYVPPLEHMFILCTLTRNLQSCPGTPKPRKTHGFYCVLRLPAWMLQSASGSPQGG